MMITDKHDERWATHSGGGRKWRGVSSYQVEDDLHGAQTHVNSLDCNSVLSLSVRPSGQTADLGDCSSLKTFLLIKVHLTQSPQNKASTRKM